MLIIEMAKIELIGGHIGFIVFYIDYQNEIRIMLIIEMDGGQNRINRRLYWIYANYRDGQNRINWRPH